jgi:hypothetical protein
MYRARDRHVDGTGSVASIEALLASCSDRRFALHLLIDTRLDGASCFGQRLEQELQEHVTFVLFDVFLLPHDRGLVVRLKPVPLNLKGSRGVGRYVRSLCDVLLTNRRQGS